MKYDWSSIVSGTLKTNENRNFDTEIYDSWMN